MANDSSWLVNYYYDHGQPDHPIAIAQQAAEVYPSQGLETMAKLLERMDRDQEAESYFEKIDERCNDAAPLHLFYARATATPPEYAEKMKTAEKETFPTGRPGGHAGTTDGQTDQGIALPRGDALSRWYGLKSGAIVVGLAGKRVRTMSPYTCVRALTISLEMDLLVYQDGLCVTNLATLLGQMFDLDCTGWP